MEFNRTKAEYSLYDFYTKYGKGLKIFHMQYLALVADIPATITDLESYINKFWELLSVEIRSDFLTQNQIQGKTPQDVLAKMIRDSQREGERV